MPDTKSGREKKGKNKRAQLTMHLAEQDRKMVDGEESEEPPIYDEADADLLADELPEEAE